MTIILPIKKSFACASIQSKHERCLLCMIITLQYTLLHWGELEVPIDHINACHLIDCEQQLESILLFHCDNPLGAGHGQRVQYNLHTLERHILRQFIAGKPVILLEIPQVNCFNLLYLKTLHAMTSLVL